METPDLRNGPVNMGGPLSLENPKTLRFLAPLKPFGPQDPLTLEPWDPETLDTIDTLLPTTPTRHLIAWRSGDGGEGSSKGYLCDV